MTQEIDFRQIIQLRLLADVLELRHVNDVPSAVMPIPLTMADDKVQRYIATGSKAEILELLEIDAAPVAPAQPAAVGLDGLSDYEADYELEQHGAAHAHAAAVTPAPQQSGQQARDEVLEEAAAICDDRHHNWRFGDGEDSVSGPKECAAAIRALKTAPSNAQADKEGGSDDGR